MTLNCEIAFLPVGNADTIIINPDDSATVIVDLHKIPLLLKWLKKKNIDDIARIYITHEHRDHFPKIEKLVTFLQSWRKRGGKIDTFCLPYDAYKNAKQKVFNDRENNKSLEDALLFLRECEKNNVIHFLEPTSGDIYTDKSLQIEVIHPALLYAQDHLVTIRGRHNEISLVLKVRYGDFTALLLADIEGEGLRECLDICTSKKLKANIVKIPHHGAYPKNGDDLKRLLEIIDPELAILSVGSTNNYGHVMPQLFSLLLNLKTDKSKKLRDFVCTEVTRTCAYSQQTIAQMNRSGLQQEQKCAGEITILANISGEWNIKTETIHKEIIAQLDYPACQGKAELI